MEDQSNADNDDNGVGVLKMEIFHPRTQINCTKLITIKPKIFKTYIIFLHIKIGFFSSFVVCNFSFSTLTCNSPSCSTPKRKLMTEAQSSFWWCQLGPQEPKTVHTWSTGANSRPLLVQNSQQLDTKDLRVWDKSGTRLGVPASYSTAQSPDPGRRAASARTAGNVYFWDSPSYQHLSVCLSVCLFVCIIRRSTVRYTLRFTWICSE